MAGGKRGGRGDADETIDALRREANGRAGAAGAAAEEQAGRLGDQLREAAQSLIEEQKGRMAEAVHEVAEVLRRTADALEREERVATARYAGQAADRIDRFSDIVRSREVGELLADAGDFARREPGLFIAGALAAGFALGRVLIRPPERRERGYATTGGEQSCHPYAPDEQPLAGFGPVVGRAEAM